MNHILFAALLAASTTFSASAHNETETATIKVWGNCGMCERTIEKAAKLPGVTSADWNKETKKLTVTYDDKKTTLEAVEKSIAAAGYDTEHFTADAKAYDNLPGCCQYDRK